MKLTEHIVSSSGPVTAAELATITKGDKLLIGKTFSSWIQSHRNTLKLT